MKILVRDPVATKPIGDKYHVVYFKRDGADIMAYSESEPCYVSGRGATELLAVAELREAIIVRNLYRGLRRRYG